jgi:transposase
MRSEDIKKEAEARYKLVTETYENGITCIAEIARKTSISRRSVSRYIRLWKARVPVEDVKPNVRPPKITAKNRSFIASEIAKQPFITAKELQLRLLEKRDVQVVII